MDCQQILHGHDAEWQPALHHDFLKRCKDGSVPAAAFNKWLEQDHHFVTDFRYFAQHVLKQAPAGDQEVLRDGLAALDDELRWFKEKIAERGLDASAARHTVTAAYCDFMQQLRGRPHPVLFVAFFAIEYVYNQAWAGVLGGDPRYQEFAERWGSADFSTYVEALRGQADSALATAKPDERREAEEIAGTQIPRLEVEFWQMASD